MSINKRQLFIRAASVLAIAGSALIGCQDCRERNPRQYGSYVQIENSHGASAEVLGSTSVSDLERRMPSFSSKLRELAKARGVAGLAELYHKTDAHLLKLMSDERLERDISYVDDLDFLSLIFEKAQGRDEKMAIIFLALPRLDEGTMVLGGQPEPGSIIFERIHAERSFLEMIADDRDVEYLQLVLMGTFSKPGGPGPDERDRMLFFDEFAKLYQP